jgi:hypothetical protein
MMRSEPFIEKIDVFWFEFRGEDYNEPKRINVKFTQHGLM